MSDKGDKGERKAVPGPGFQTRLDSLPDVSQGLSLCAPLRDTAREGRALRQPVPLSEPLPK